MIVVPARLPADVGVVDPPVEDLLELPQAAAKSVSGATKPAIAHRKPVDLVMGY